MFKAFIAVTTALISLTGLQIPEAKAHKHFSIEGGYRTCVYYYIYDRYSRDKWDRMNHEQKTRVQASAHQRCK